MKQLTIDTHKKCSKCQSLKSLEHFRRDKSKVDGYEYQCKKCRSIRDLKYREKNRDLINLRQKSWPSVTSRTGPTESYRKTRRLEIDECRDTYIKKLLTHKNGLAYKDIPKELIDCVRLKILINRHVRNLENEKR